MSKSHSNPTCHVDRNPFKLSRNLPMPNLFCYPLTQNQTVPPASSLIRRSLIHFLLVAGCLAVVAFSSASPALAQSKSPIYTGAGDIVDDAVLEDLWEAERKTIEAEYLRFVFGPGGNEDEEDLDGDGESSINVDCDDTNGSIGPAEVEILCEDPDDSHQLKMDEFDRNLENELGKLLDFLPINAPADEQELLFDELYQIDPILAVGLLEVADELLRIEAQLPRNTGSLQSPGHRVGFNPQPQPPGHRVGFNPQPQPPGHRVGLDPMGP